MPPVFICFFSDFLPISPLSVSSSCGPVTTCWHRVSFCAPRLQPLPPKDSIREGFWWCFFFFFCVFCWCVGGVFLLCFFCFFCFFFCVGGLVLGGCVFFFLVCVCPQPKSSVSFNCSQNSQLTLPKFPRTTFRVSRPSTLISLKLFFPPSPRWLLKEIFYIPPLR